MDARFENLNPNVGTPQPASFRWWCRGGIYPALAEAGLSGTKGGIDAAPTRQNSEFESLLLEEILADVGELALVNEAESLLKLVDEARDGLSARAD